MLGTSADTAYKYTAAGVYTGENFTVGSQDTNPAGIESVGSDLWVVGGATDAAYKYAPQIGVTSLIGNNLPRGHQNYVRIK